MPIGVASVLVRIEGLDHEAAEALQRALHELSELAELLLQIAADKLDTPDNDGVHNVMSTDDITKTEPVSVRCIICMGGSAAATRTAVTAMQTAATMLTAFVERRFGTATSSTSSTTTSSSALFGMNAAVLYGAGATTELTSAV